MFNRKKLEDNLIKIYLQLYLKYIQNRTLSYKSMSSKKKKTLYKFFLKKGKKVNYDTKPTKKKKKKFNCM